MLCVTQKACNVLQNPKFASEEVQKSNFITCSLNLDNN